MVPSNLPDQKDKSEVNEGSWGTGEQGNKMAGREDKMTKAERTKRGKKLT